MGPVFRVSPAWTQATDQGCNLISGAGVSSKLTGCWQNTVPCGCRTEGPVFLLGVNWGLHLAPRSLLSLPSHNMSVCPPVEEYLSNASPLVKGFTWLSQAHPGQSPFWLTPSQQMSNLTKRVISHQIHRLCLYLRGGDYTGMYTRVWES